jgi:hypothetical protein
MRPPPALESKASHEERIDGHEEGSERGQFDIERCLLHSPPRLAACVIPAGPSLLLGARRLVRHQVADRWGWVSGRHGPVKRSSYSRCLRPTGGIKDRYRVKVVAPPRHFAILDRDDGDETIVVRATRLDCLAVHLVLEDND